MKTFKLITTIQDETYLIKHITIKESDDLDDLIKFRDSLNMRPMKDYPYVIQGKDPYYIIDNRIDLPIETKKIYEEVYRLV